MTRLMIGESGELGYEKKWPRRHLRVEKIFGGDKAMKVKVVKTFLLSSEKKAFENRIGTKNLTLLVDHSRYLIFSCFFLSIFFDIYFKIFFYLLLYHIFVSSNKNYWKFCWCRWPKDSKIISLTSYLSKAKALN